MEKCYKLKVANFTRDCIEYRTFTQIEQLNTGCYYCTGCTILQLMNRPSWFKNIDRQVTFRNCKKRMSRAPQLTQYYHIRKPPPVIVYPRASSRSVSDSYCTISNDTSTPKAVTSLFTITSRAPRAHNTTKPREMTKRYQAGHLMS